MRPIPHPDASGLEKAGAKKAEHKPEAVIGDKGYDSLENPDKSGLVFKDCGAAPIIPIREKADAQIADICNAKGTPTCPDDGH